jgi:hypothetical protein
MIKQSVNGIEAQFITSLMVMLLMFLMRQCFALLVNINFHILGTQTSGSLAI